MRMGVLDDAIREHLDLKRRRGADPAEVERAAREALGPVRRGPIELAGGQPHTTGQAPAYDHEFEDDQQATQLHQLEDDQRATYLHELEPVQRAEPFEENTEPSQTSPPPYRAAEPPISWKSTPSQDHFGSVEAPAARATSDGAGPAPPPEPHVDEPPVRDQVGTKGHLGHDDAEYDVDETRRSPSEKGVEGGPGETHSDEPSKQGEDVLEETPEFLQDAPEHDRLWFEQRPPRDFDFDG